MWRAVCAFFSIISFWIVDFHLLAQHTPLKITHKLIPLDVISKPKDTREFNLLKVKTSKWLLFTMHSVYARTQYIYGMVKCISCSSLRKPEMLKTASKQATRQADTFYPISNYAYDFLSMLFSRSNVNSNIDL